LQVDRIYLLDPSCSRPTFWFGQVMAITVRHGHPGLLSARRTGIDRGESNQEEVYPEQIEPNPNS
jgi:hypothetical protein